VGLGQDLAAATTAALSVNFTHPDISLAKPTSLVIHSQQLTHFRLLLAPFVRWDEGLETDWFTSGAAQLLVARISHQIAHIAALSIARRTTATSSTHVGYRNLNLEFRERKLKIWVITGIG